MKYWKVYFIFDTENYYASWMHKINRRKLSITREGSKKKVCSCTVIIIGEIIGVRKK